MQDLERCPARTNASPFLLVIAAVVGMPRPPYVDPNTTSVCTVERRNQVSAKASYVKWKREGSRDGRERAFNGTVMLMPRAEMDEGLHINLLGEGSMFLFGSTFSPKEKEDIGR